MENSPEVPLHERRFSEFIDHLSVLPPTKNWYDFAYNDLKRYRSDPRHYYREYRAMDLIKLTNTGNSGEIEKPRNEAIKVGINIRRELEETAKAISPQFGFASNDLHIKGISVYYINQVLLDLEREEGEKRTKE